MGQGPLSLEIEIPSDIGYIEDVVAEVVRRCEAAAFPGRHVAFHIPVALTEALSNAILRGNAPPPRVSVPDLPEELEALILRGMQKEPANRFPSVGAMGRALLPFASERIQLMYEQELSLLKSSTPS